MSPRSRVSEEKSPWAKADGLVFLGVHVSWQARVSDLEYNTSLAERWEERFSDWDIDERVVKLNAPSDGYYVRLSDGHAEFRVESAVAYGHALEHFRQLIEGLDRVRRQKRNVYIDAQYLLPVAEEFEALVKRLESSLLNTAFGLSLQAEMHDFAYLADFHRDGDSFQLNLGPVRAPEVRRRVAAKNLVTLPEVAIFYKVSSGRQASRGAHQLGAFVDHIFELGRLVARRLSA